MTAGIMTGGLKSIADIEKNGIEARGTVAVFPANDSANTSNFDQKGYDNSANKILGESGTKAVDAIVDDKKAITAAETITKSPSLV